LLLGDNIWSKAERDNFVTIYAGATPVVVAAGCP
jgi:hypothetical protein